MSTTTKKAAAGERVAAALAARPEGTAAELAADTGLGQSTVGKALTALEADGAACRRPGGHDGARRLPDRWSATPAAEDAVSPAPVGPATPKPAKAACGQVDGRLRSGQLREVVAELLAGATEPVSPTRLAKAAGGRSAGAVGNCLERLVATGVAVRVSDRPKTYLPATEPARRSAS